ncbi:MAG: type II secretion system protein GspM [Leucothrix sp.]
MKQWFMMLSSREKTIVSIAAVLVPLLLTWLLVLQPMLKESASLTSAIKDRSEILEKVRLQSTQIKMLQSNGKRNTKVNRGNPQQKVESALQTWRLRPNLGVMSAPNSRTVKLNLKDAEADNIMRFLFDVETKYGLAVKAASLKPTKDIGRANASLTLEAQ